MDLKHQKESAIGTAIQDNLRLVLRENTVLAEQLDFNQLVELIHAIQEADAIFLIAAGRSGFSMRSVAMRLMHLGLKVYFVGDNTTPAIKMDDLLWAVSGSGTTSGIVRAAEKAKQVGAKVFAITTNETSALATLAQHHMLVPAAAKLDRAGEKSAQYAGSLFEQTLLLLGDAVFMELWKIDGTPAQELWKRHANME